MLMLFCYNKPSKKTGALPPALTIYDATGEKVGIGRRWSDNRGNGPTRLYYKIHIYDVDMPGRYTLAHQYNRLVLQEDATQMVMALRTSADARRRKEAA